MHRPLIRVGAMRTYTSRAPPAHGSRCVRSSRRFTSRSSATSCARPCTRTLQPARSAWSRWSTSKLTCPLAYKASSVSGAVRKMMVFPFTAKLTGSIMIPSADANPARPMPPSSSSPKHSAGLSAPAGNARGQRARGLATPGRARHLAHPGCSPLPFRLSYIFTFAICGLFALSALSCRVDGRRGPMSRLGGPFGPRRHPRSPDRAPLAEALALSNDQALRPILAGERRPVRDRAAGHRSPSRWLCDAGYMRMRFPRRRAKTAGRSPDGQADWSPPPALGDRACCCPARPVVRVLIPPASARPHSV